MKIMSICDARSDLEFLKKRLDILQTFVGDLFCPNLAESAISKTMPEKIAVCSWFVVSKHFLCDAGIDGILSGTHYCQ